MSDPLRDTHAWSLLAAQAEGAGAGQAPDFAALLAALEGFDPAEIEAACQTELRRLPTPLHPRHDLPLVRRRGCFERILAELAARRGETDGLARMLRQEWAACPDKALALVERLADLGHRDEAATMARFALREEDCSDREALEQRLTELGSPPEGWVAALEDFARNPSLERWRDLDRFIPLEVCYQRLRNTLAILQRLGVEGDLLFRIATLNGTVPDAFELVDRGLVAPETVLARADESNSVARASWWGLAARAALARGDRSRAVCLLRDAYALRSPLPPDLDARSIRERADAELHQQLDRAGIPRFDAPAG